jgi:hypothetical protein
LILGGWDIAAASPGWSWKESVTLLLAAVFAVPAAFLVYMGHGAYVRSRVIGRRVSYWKKDASLRGELRWGCLFIVAAGLLAATLAAFPEVLYGLLTSLKVAEGPDLSTSVVNRRFIAVNSSLLVYTAASVLFLRGFSLHLKLLAVDTFYEAGFAFDRLMHDQILRDRDGRSWALWHEWNTTLRIPIPGWRPPRKPIVPEEPSVRWGRGDDDE